MSGSNSEEDILVCTPYEKWNGSTDSIIAQKILKLSQSETLFKFQDCSPSPTFPDYQLREFRKKNSQENTQNLEILARKTRLSKMVQTRSLLKDELNILKINMSKQDKPIELEESQMMKDLRKKDWVKGRRFTKFVSKFLLLQKLHFSNVKDLLVDIEESESAKNDKKVWKFLKRGPSFRREAINTRKLQLQIQTLQFPGVGYVSDSVFQNTLPVKITCPNCCFYITTSVKKVSTIRTKLTSLVLAIVRLCIVPHVFYAFKDTVHLCPLCNVYLGFCPAFNIRLKSRSSEICNMQRESILERRRKMVSASSTSAKNLFVESKLRLSDRVQVNVNNIAAIARQIQRGSKANENLITAAKNFVSQEAAIENSETNLKKLKLLTTHLNNQVDSLHNSSSKIETVLEQVCSMQR